MHSSVVSAVKRTIPISQFNRGLAGKIFSDVKKNGPRVVVKNNEPEVVLLSPQEYVELMEDQELLSLALERLEHYDSSSVISSEEMDRKLAFTQEELDSVGEVEFE